VATEVRDAFKSWCEDRLIFGFREPGRADFLSTKEPSMSDLIRPNATLPRLWSLFLGAVLLIHSSLLAQAEEKGQSAKPPNILFIFTDDHAYQAISCYGSILNQTPNIDRLAAAGMRFDRCLVTNSICGPSRAVILSGKYSHLNGFRQNGDRFDGSQMTFPKLLQTAGYQTALFGKWHLESEPTGFNQWMVLPDQGQYYNPKFLIPGGETTVQGYCTEIITERSLRWLEEERDQQQPFLLMVQHKAPKQLNLYRDVTFPEPETLFDDYANRASVLKENQMEIGRHMRPGEDLKLWRPDDQSKAADNFFRRMTPQQRQAWNDAYASDNERYFTQKLEGREQTQYFYQRYLQDYLRCIAAVDEGIGDLLDYLEKSGLAENTIVVYSSDQGFYLGEHGWYDKRWAFEQSLRTPLVVRWPGVVPPGSSNADLVSNLDFAPTFLTAAGVQPPAEMQGKPLQPLLRGEPAPSDWRKSFYYRYYELGTHNVAAHEAVVTADHKLIHYTARLNAERKREAIDEWDLIDLRLDPNELRSFYSAPSHSEIRTRLERELQRLRVELKAD
jgi:arylsulfatase A-like enzyme